MLSAVNLPGGVQVWQISHHQHFRYFCLSAADFADCNFTAVQRRRTAEDELNMREVYTEGDLISVSLSKPHIRCHFMQISAAAALQSQEVQAYTVI